MCLFVFSFLIYTIQEKGMLIYFIYIAIYCIERLTKSISFIVVSYRLNKKTKIYVGGHPYSVSRLLNVDSTLGF